MEKDCDKLIPGKAYTFEEATLFYVLSMWERDKVSGTRPTSEPLAFCVWKRLGEEEEEHTCSASLPEGHYLRTNGMPGKHAGMQAASLSCHFWALFSSQPGSSCTFAGPSEGRENSGGQLLRTFSCDLERTVTCGSALYVSHMLFFKRTSASSAGWEEERRRGEEAVLHLAWALIFHFICTCAVAHSDCCSAFCSQSGPGGGEEASVSEAFWETSSRADYSLCLLPPSGTCQLFMVQCFCLSVCLPCGSALPGDAGEYTLLPGYHCSSWTG